ncbi:MerR family transcriptional regulator [uncultured Clostridium sp.]|jgi:DNA-binding transcriptional MerR regulator|uniref:helix-turn-helix domain-containing protein n=1 Tax=uncultured Clostridium sp. TaxID=59620 RepID=UPI002615A874|nr:MerR family transcriptional regulator [uncultured Clostridium sp.]
MYFLIGEVSKIFDISIDTLRYYDKIDLFKPSIISNSGYRLYSMADLNKLKFILASKKIGINLKEIIRIQESSNISDYKELINKQEILITKKLEELTLIKEYIKETKNSFFDMIKDDDLTKMIKLKFSKENSVYYHVNIREIFKDKMYELLKYLSNENQGPRWFSDYTFTNNELIQGNSMYLNTQLANLDIIKNTEKILNMPLDIFILEADVVTLKVKGSQKEILDHIAKLIEYNNLNKETIMILGKRLGLLLSNNAKWYYGEIKILKNINYKKKSTNSK